MLSGALLVLFAFAQPSVLEESLSDPMAGRCQWGRDDEANKTKVALTLGYIYGYAEAVGPATSRISVDQPRLAGRVAELCARNPSMQLREIAETVIKERARLMKRQLWGR